MISISGIRGTIPEGLNLETIFLYSKAFAEHLNSKTAVIGLDGRPSGQFIKSILEGVLLSLGKNVIDLGIVPTPTVKSVIKETRSGGGVMVSASHNPIHWNAFKLIGKNGFFYNQKELDEFLSIAGSNPSPKPLFLPESNVYNDSKKYIALHLESVLKWIDIGRIRKRKFKVLIDSVNAGGSIVVPALLERLGCKVIKLNCEPTGKFARPPEPTPKALQVTSKKMKSSGCDIGFALDPDADRLVVLTPKKGAISEEYTLPLSILSVIEDSPKNGKIVVNLSTSFIIEEILNKYGKKLLRSKVGEANVVEMMQKERAFFGGEGNGGVIDPKISSFGRDSLSGIAHILNRLSMSREKIDEIVDFLPKIYMEKTSFSSSGWEIRSLFDKFKSSFSPNTIDERDGLRMEFSSSWIHIRSSNTEPIIRVIAETKNENDLKQILEKAKEISEK